ncbi:TonB-dependent receptor [Pseudomonas sp. GV071]|uniref:TonB-dependent siderophore receptor n=1 Tax=Pseudomonas sp. GV071 TaxID=2135754 RepID=UPI000D352BDD|nr:TonB-dependent receptor [Pseudomonas sp. GV071]PTQ69412.1 outer membrane receptor for ferric coprogen and ferric-rhodotorulic acid [Pseudomonas sp. GV071]
MTQHHNPLARGIRLALFGFALGGPLLLGAVQPAWAQTDASQIRYQIAPGPLGTVLSQFAAASGVMLSFASSQTAGLSSPGLQGEYSLQEGFAKLLAGSNLQLRQEGATRYSLVTLQTGGALELGATDINGQTLGSTTEGSGSYTTGAVTIGKGEQKLKDIPQSVSVLTRQRMDDQNITSLTEALINTTGMTSTKSPGPGMFIFSRGFDIEALQYDGVPTPRNVYSLGSYLTESMVIYDRVEFLRGAAGLLQGANSPGGAVNLVRKRGQAKPTVTITGKAGSWDRYGLQLDAGGPLNDEGTIRGRTVVDYQQGDSFVDYKWNWDQTVYGALDFDLSDSTTLGVGFNHHQGHYRPFFLGLMRYADGGDLDLSRSTYTGSTWNRGTNDQTSVYLDLEHRFNDDWKFKTSMFGMFESNEATYQYMVVAAQPDGSGPRHFNYSTDYQSKNRGLDMYVDGKFEGLGFEQSAVLGANYSKYTSHGAYAAYRTPGANIFDIDHHRPNWDMDSIAAAGELDPSQYDVRQKGIYGTWRVKLLDPLTMILGARTSWYEYQYTSQYIEQGIEYPEWGSDSKIKNSGRVTPYAGLVYELTPEWSVYGSVSDVFIPQPEPTFDKQPLKPIEGTNYETGLKGELADGRVNVSFALFRYDQENRATQLPELGYVCANGSLCSRASGKVRSQGFEAEVTGEVLTDLQLSAGYTYNTTKYLKDPEKQGSIFSTWTPKHMLRLWANYKLPGDFNRVSVGAGVNANSHTPSMYGEFELPGVAIWSSRLAYQATDEIGVAMNLNNVFDKKYYIPSYNDINGGNYYGDPRNVMFTVKYTPQF